MLWHEQAAWTRMLLVSILSGSEDVNSILAKLGRNQEDIGDALKPYLSKFVFCWDDVPGNDTEKIKEFLIQNFGVNWIKGPNVVSVNKAEDGKAVRIASGDNLLSVNLNDEMTKAGITIEVGSKSFDFSFNVKKENGKTNVYLDNSENRNMLTAMLKSNVTITKNLIQSVKAGDTGRSLDAEEALKANGISIASFLYGLNPAWSYKPLSTLFENSIKLTKEEAVARMNKNYDAGIAAYGKAVECALKIADALTEGATKIQ